MGFICPLALRFSPLSPSGQPSPSDLPVCLLVSMSPAPGSDPRAQAQAVIDAASKGELSVQGAQNVRAETANL